MQRTYEHLKGLEVPELLLRLYAYMEGPEFGGLDLEIPEEGFSKVESLVGDVAAAQLVPLLQHGSDSMIVAWRQGDSVDLGSFPVAWLDSEGSPNAIFAMDIRHLLALLHFPAGCVYDMIRHSQRLRSRNESTPSRRFSREAMREKLEEEIAESEELDLFHRWLQGEVGIIVPEDPCSDVLAAQIRYSNFATSIGVEEG